MILLCVNKPESARWLESYDCVMTTKSWPSSHRLLRF